ncbi:unnamed protein product [Adineta ricciae]|uniref:U-box domain-containing protein n=1 Tax=Adineta ricciae TaxID=249248 RepID=A0A814A1C1_ADIRI|nr:unnamed protein product [Adineta ricciae]
MEGEPSTSTVQVPIDADAVEEAATPDDTHVFMEAYECAKNNYRWEKVVSAISTHPEWLTRIPAGRRWTMLHQIVYGGNVSHLNEILALEISNEEFRLLYKALDDKTVREVASERAHLYPQMLRRIERLVAIDQLLNNARDSKWELVKQFLHQQADIVNEKPPYRKYYLAHYLAYTGQLEIFQELREICIFRLDLFADHKTINRVARENNHIEFAEYVEQLCPDINEITEESNPTTPSATDEESAHATTNPFQLNHPLFDDSGLMIFALNSNSIGNVLSLSSSSLLNTNNHPDSAANYYHDQYSASAASNATHSQSNSSHSEHDNAKKSKAYIPPSMTDEQQAQYEKAIIENMKKLPAHNSFTSAITCCITKEIFREPVLAADGFTYEREAILNWFEQSSRSPMTNEELENKELKHNHAMKSILRSLSETNKNAEKSNGK